MLALALLLSTALQDRPVLQELSTLTDGYARSGCWLPLKARITGPVAEKNLL